MAIRTRSLQNCWGRDQGNHKTVDGQGLHESQGQQPVGAAHQQHSANDTFLHDAGNSMRRSGSKYATLPASKRQDTAEVVRDLRTISSRNQNTRHGSTMLVQPVWRGLVETRSRSQPSILEAGCNGLRLTGNAVNAAAAGNALKRSKKVAATSRHRDTVQTAKRASPSSTLWTEQPK